MTDRPLLTEACATATPGDVEASDVSISFVVDEAEAPELVRRLHLSLIELKDEQDGKASEGKERNRP